MLLDEDAISDAEKIVDFVQKVDLASNEVFQKEYIDAMNFEL